jgi:nitrate reductase NapD
MAEREGHVISSAVVTVLPGRLDDVAAALAALEETEVAAAAGARIVIVLEGRGRGAVGGRLAAIALMDGVVSANMVFEHVEEPEEETRA